MQEAVKPQVRYRVEVGTTAEGVHTYSCTVELVDDFPDTDFTWDWIRNMILSESDKLVTELDIKYPVGGGG